MVTERLLTRVADLLWNLTILLGSVLTVVGVNVMQRSKDKGESPDFPICWWDRSRAGNMKSPTIGASPTPVTAYSYSGISAKNRPMSPGGRLFFNASIQE